MVRQDVLGLIGLLVVLYAGLWLSRGLVPPNLPWMSQSSPQFSPMDMPGWYRLPLEQGHHYIELKSSSKLSQKKLTEKRAAVRGF